MLFWTPHFSVLDSTFFVLDSTFWLDSTLKIDPDPSSRLIGSRVQFRKTAEITSVEGGVRLLTDC